MNKDNPVFALPAPITYPFLDSRNSRKFVPSRKHGARPRRWSLSIPLRRSRFAGINQEGQGVGEEPAEYSRDLTVE